ncbi:hypothetical protein ACLB2K_070825 [Fragaria x ananassa]
MSLSPKSSPPELTPTSSRPSPAKNSRPNSPEKDDSQMSDAVLPAVKDGSGISDALLAELGCTREYLLLTTRERDEMTIKAIVAREEARGEVVRSGSPPPYRPETLPKGYAWGSYIAWSGDKDYACLMTCGNCGKDGLHKTLDCPDKDTEEAKEFRRRITSRLRGL